MPAELLLVSCMHTVSGLKKAFSPDRPLPEFPAPRIHVTGTSVPDTYLPRDTRTVQYSYNTVPHTEFGINVVLSWRKFICLPKRPRLLHFQCVYLFIDLR